MQKIFPFLQTDGIVEEKDEWNNYPYVDKL